MRCRVQTTADGNWICEVVKLRVLPASLLFQMLNLALPFKCSSKAAILQIGSAAAMPLLVCCDCYDHSKVTVSL
jgi:hypothetical protein